MHRSPGGAAAPPDGRVVPDGAGLDKRILDASITNAALELLPETLASMAILPLQVRMVYRIGQAHGYELDSGHIKEFIATLGVGMTGQYLEQIARRLLGGALGSMLGGIGGSLGRQAASSGMAFASTWAIGQLAKQYYGGGRSLDAARLKAAFSPLVDQGQALIVALRSGDRRSALGRSTCASFPQLIRELLAADRRRAALTAHPTVEEPPNAASAPRAAIAMAVAMGRDVPSCATPTR